MTPDQLAELFVEEQCDNTMNIHTCIEILIKNAYKAGYACAVDKTEEWLEEQVEMIGVSFTDDYTVQHSLAGIDWVTQGASCRCKTSSTNCWKPATHHCRIRPMLA